MSEVYAQPVPEVLWFDWAVIFAGLGIGVGMVFQLIDFSVAEKNKHRVYTLSNFWLILSGVIHSWIEFNMVYYRSDSLITPTMDMYGAADFRYGNYNGRMESGTAAMEAITALLDGPLCFLVAYGAAHNCNFRFPLQIILCTMQLYGLLWFVLQPVFTDSGISGHFSSDPVLFWAIAVGANAPWAIAPVILLVQAFNECCKRFDRRADI